MRRQNKKKYWYDDNIISSSMIPYQVYSDLGEIDPLTIETKEDWENYYKSLLYGCKNCNIIKPSKLQMIIHSIDYATGLNECSNNGRSKYEHHKKEAFNRRIERERQEK